MKRYRFGAWIGQETYIDKKAGIDEQTGKPKRKHQLPGPSNIKPSAVKRATIAKRSNAALRLRTTQWPGRLVQKQNHYRAVTKAEVIKGTPVSVGEFLERIATVVPSRSESRADSWWAW